MNDHKSNVTVDMGSERNFGFVFAVVFSLFAFFPVLRGHDPRWTLAAIAALFALLALFAPAALKWPNRIWFRFGLILGAIIAPIIMALVFLVAFIPTGLLLRLTGKDLLSLRLEPEAESYWIERTTPPMSMRLQY
ncbi:SxtJ family membrane protein [Oceanomicrobium pacificus]|uniref:SxtJ n=1 Tax=Oceanomicrobium pacificus TaxID=2692916 RepID=A0A6B0TZL8_9RHOB|nr:SxtJ family membrane protein [Oceanomicrobium pacificus]MXU64341.1 hypothetical protein [Oceanomicrobium pacificus]